jgi:radical SAM protein with 4Fe4S-binding SPASM domain
MKGDLLSHISTRYQEARAPLSVLFEVTHRCNLPCVHCYLPNHLDNGELSFAEVCNVLDQLAEAGTMFLTLTGGEVMSRGDFLEILDAAHERGFVLKVLTNGTLISDEVADRFLQAGVLEVSISVYGSDAAVHDQVTEMPGSYDRTMEGIQKLRARGIHVVMKTPLLTLNGQLAKDLQLMAMMQNMPCNFDLAVQPKNNRDMGPLALAMHHEAMVNLMMEPSLTDILVPGPGTGPGPEPCNAGRNYCAVGPTGDLMPCIMMPTVVGNLRTQAFSDLWQRAPFFERLRAIESEDLATCRSCDLKGSCSRCPGNAMQRGQDVDGCDLSAKQVAKARIAARTRLHVIQ